MKEGASCCASACAMSLRVSMYSRCIGQPAQAEEPHVLYVSPDVIVRELIFTEATIK